MMETIAIIALAFAFGGILKGATGVGAPILAIPLLALFFDMPFAITIFSIPNLLPNIWQAWTYRRERLPRVFNLRFALAGGLGAATGTYLLANIPSHLLEQVLALVVLVYVGFRLFHPSWKLPYPAARALAAPVGVLAGALQASAGLSAPVSITFLTAMRLDRGTFITTISTFFVALGVIQIPMLIYYGFLTPHTAMLSAAALIPLIAAMPLGAWLIRRVPRERFEMVLLVILVGLSLKLLSGFFF
ncbi:MAG: sulfite exporter TauE/SafE family protein [Rhodobacteraceae bacterium]|nr:sulfite exporter TauE/SafE family protein [Paracoccaceae bacterium]